MIKQELVKHFFFFLLHRLAKKANFTLLRKTHLNSPHIRLSSISMCLLNTVLVQKQTFLFNPEILEENKMTTVAEELCTL